MIQDSINSHVRSPSCGNFFGVAGSLSISLVLRGLFRFLSLNYMVLDAD